MLGVPSLFHVQGIEKGLNDEIQYLNQVSTTQAHEGSVYGIEKVMVPLLATGPRIIIYIKSP